MKMDTCPSQGQESRRRSCSEAGSEQRKLKTQGAHSRSGPRPEGHPEGRCGLIARQTPEGGKDVRVTCPLQSQGVLKATYSSSLLYMPTLILVGFSLASSWNRILAMLSKSLER